MKTRYLLATLFSLALLNFGLSAQNLKPGTVTFQNIYGNVSSQNLNTGAFETITEESLITEGFVLRTDANGYLDIIFSNGVVGRLAPNSKLEIEAFAETGGRRSREERMSLSSGNRAASLDQPGLHLKLECGDILVNATAKTEGDLLVKTPITENKSDLGKFFVSHGSSNNSDDGVSRSLNLGSDPLEVSSLVGDDFVQSTAELTYSQYNQSENSKSKSLSIDQSVIIMAEDLEDSSPDQTVDDTHYTTQTTTTDPYNYSDQSMNSCNSARYSLIPFDPCYRDRLGMIADHILIGGENPDGEIIVTAADRNATYINVNSGEAGDMVAGMKMTEGSIIRTPGEGSATVIFPNGAIMTVDPLSNVFIESVSTQPVLSNGAFDNQTNVLIRVESGRIVNNTINTRTADTFEVISPLDSHTIPSNTIVSVEFLQMDTNAFQTVSQNQTEQGNIGLNTTVIANADLSFVSDAVTFIEFAADGNPFTFVTPPSFTHITESAIIPPGYDFIDRTIVFAAGATPGPTPLGTPGNPGNILQNNNEDPDPETP